SDRTLYSQLIDDAKMWRENAEATSFLYRDARLSAVRQAAERGRLGPPPYPGVPGYAHHLLTASYRAANPPPPPPPIVLAARGRPGSADPRRCDRRRGCQQVRCRREPATCNRVVAAAHDAKSDH